MCATRVPIKLRRVIQALSIILCMLFMPSAMARGINVHCENNLVVNDVYPFGEDDWQSYPQISGLLNKRVEHLINSRIEEMYTSLCQADLPAYRGVYLMADRNDWKSDANPRVQAYVEASVDNLICVSATRYLTLKNPRTHEDVDVSEIRSSTYDLRTGREITLGDLFSDGVDYKQYIRNAVSDYCLSVGACDEYESVDADYLDDRVSVYAPYFTQVAPFTDVMRDQKFVLRGFGPYLWLSLILDDATPEFQTDFAWKQIDIPFCDDMNFNKRFRTRESIFEGGDGSWFFAETPAESVPIVPHERTTRPLGDGEELYCHFEAITATDWPSELTDAVLEMPSKHDATDMVLKAYEKYRSDGGTAAVYADVYTSFDRVDEFVSVRTRISVNTEDDEGSYNELMWETFRESFRISDAKKVDANMIFTQDDWTGALAKAIHSSIERMPREDIESIAPGSTGDDALWLDVARVLSENVETFIIGSTDLMLCYSDDAVAALALGVDKDAVLDNFCTVSYKDIGFENMRLFQ